MSASTTTGVVENATLRFAVTDATGAFVTIAPTVSGVPVQVELIDQVTTTAPFGTAPTTVPPSAIFMVMAVFKAGG